MGSNSLRQQQKRKARERRVRQDRLDGERRHLEAERRKVYLKTYPDFYFEPNNADPDFVALIREAVSKVNFEDESMFREWEALFYREVKSRGATRAYAQLEAVIPEIVKSGNEMARFAQVQLDLNLGQVVFNLIPEKDLDQFLPFNDVMLVTSGSGIRVIFRALLRTKGKGGTSYSSPHKPTIEIDGQAKFVAFTDHAMQRIYERIEPKWKTYAGLGHVFGYFGTCVYFEKCELYGGQLGFTFYDICDDDKFWQHSYVLDVFGKEKVDPTAGPCYYRVGYCPAVVEGDYIKAKTLLFPGYSSTPEYGAILRFARTTRERQELLEMSKHLDAQHLIQSQDMSVIKWFHDHGVPQVVQFNHDVFIP